MRDFSILTDYRIKFCKKHDRLFIRKCSKCEEWGKTHAPCNNCRKVWESDGIVSLPCLLANRTKCMQVWLQDLGRYFMVKKIERQQLDDQSVNEWAVWDQEREVSI